MNQLVVFFLGLIIGIVIGVLGSNLAKFSGTKYQVEQNFITLEDMFEQFMTELENKHKAIISEINEREILLNERNQTQTEKRSIEKKVVNDSPKVKAIKELLKKGYIPELVAKQLGIGKGEVELLIQLEKLQNSD